MAARIGSCMHSTAPMVIVEPSRRGQAMGLVPHCPGSPIEKTSSTRGWATWRNGDRPRAPLPRWPREPGPPRPRPRRAVHAPTRSWTPPSTSSCRRASWPGSTCARWPTTSASRRRTSTTGSGPARSCCERRWPARPAGSRSPWPSPRASGFVARRLRMFDAIAETRPLTLTALLALDGDPGYRPLPYLEATLDHYRALVDDGRAAGRPRRRGRPPRVAGDVDRGRHLRRGRGRASSASASDEVHARARAVFAPACSTRWSPRATSAATRTP